jgi:hypothetical protein
VQVLFADAVCGDFQGIDDVGLVHARWSFCEQG